MATLLNLKTPFQNLSHQSQLDIIMSIRDSRRTPKKPLKATKTKTSTKKGRVTKPFSIDDLTPEQKLNLLKILEAKENE